MSERAYVALGSNLGDRVAHLARALSALDATPGITLAGVSPIYETDPVGPPGQGPYLNAAAALDTELPPRALLERLLAIETQAGRVRGPERNAARSLDLDLLFHGARRIEEPDLVVPHPRLHERAFVLTPLADLAPELVHPRLGDRIEALAARAGDPAAVRPAPWADSSCVDYGLPISARRTPVPEESSPMSASALQQENLNSSRVLDLIARGEAEAWKPPEILTWAIKNFHPRLALSCSFGNPEGLVLLDMMQRIEPAARVFTLDTGRMPQETYDLIDRVRDRYDLRVEAVCPDAQAVQAMVNEHGMNLFYESLEKRQLCCRLRKVEPNRRFLAGLDAYVTGLRREQNVTRESVGKIEIDPGHGVVKVNPLADWSHDDVWSYVRANDVPTNRLHQAGYPTVGCAPCTRAVRPGEDPRAGRWWWENPDTKECGLHVDQESEGSGI